MYVVCVEMLAAWLLGLFEAFAGGSQEGALGRGQGAVGFSHQVRMGCDHGLPACCLHYLCSVAGERDREVRTRETGTEGENGQTLDLEKATHIVSQDQHLAPAISKCILSVCIYACLKPL